MLTELMGLRFDLATYELVCQVARAQGIGACDFVRMATRRELARLGYMPPEDLKALGMMEPKTGEKEEKEEK